VRRRLALPRASWDQSPFACCGSDETWPGQALDGLPRSSSSAWGAPAMTKRVLHGAIGLTLLLGLSACTGATHCRRRPAGRGHGRGDRWCRWRRPRRGIGGGDRRRDRSGCRGRDHPATAAAAGLLSAARQSGILPIRLSTASGRLCAVAGQLYAVGAAAIILRRRCPTSSRTPAELRQTGARRRSAQHGRSHPGAGEPAAVVDCCNRLRRRLISMMRPIPRAK
jgi:hypothetical protein